MSDCSRCTGHCCKDFTLPISPMELKHEAEKHRRTGRSRWSEIEKVAAMVIFKFQDWTVSGVHRGLRKARGSKRHGDLPQYHYTCKHFDAASGNCGDYENRPAMCRDYPYGRSCAYRGCTMKAKEAPRLKVECLNEAKETEC